MKTEIAQIIALTAYGNDYLKTGNIPEDFNTSNKTFEFCNSIDFRELKKSLITSKYKEVIIARNPTEWFHYLKNSGSKYLRVYFESLQNQTGVKDYKVAGFISGGGKWLIEAVYDNFSNFWMYRWKVVNKNSPNVTWSVNYGMVGKEMPTKNLQIANLKIKEKFYRSLSEIADYAAQKGLRYWKNKFNIAKETLDSATPEKNCYYDDALPLDRYNLPAKQLVFAACASWVFGAMGSWNDVYFKNKKDFEKYDKLSEQLYESIVEAIIAGTNTY